MTSKVDHIGDLPRILGAGIKVKSAQTEAQYLEDQVSVQDRGIQVISGRHPNKPLTMFMNNTSQTDHSGFRYSVYVLFFFFLFALSVWHAHVSFNIYYEVYNLKQPQNDVPYLYRILRMLPFVGRILG